jgi:hypothetical protein
MKIIISVISLWIVLLAILAVSLFSYRCKPCLENSVYKVSITEIGDTERYRSGEHYRYETNIWVYNHTTDKSDLIIVRSRNADTYDKKYIGKKFNTFGYRMENGDIEYCSFSEDYMRYWNYE